MVVLGSGKGGASISSILAAGAVGPILTGQSPSNILLGCAIGAMGAVGAGAAASATVARVIAGITGSAAGGLSGAGDVLSGNDTPNSNPDTINLTDNLPDWGSPDPVDPDVYKKFCQLNPNAPNCQPDPGDCP